MKIIKTSSKTKRNSEKAPAIQKFEKMFREIQVQPNIDKEPDFNRNEQPTWIVSDNNSTFKSFINHG